MQIVSLKLDYCFKDVFANETVRKHFISDMLGIPVEEIRSVRLLNTFMRKRTRKQKTGILDLLAELNDRVKINIELQVNEEMYWDKRQIFYLSRMFSEELRAGENYGKLKKCVAISILDYNLTARGEYHSVYKLRDEKGNLFSDMIEIHTLELKKKLTGDNPEDNWIRLFNAESKEDLDMIKTKNPGIQEAIRELRRLSLGRILRAHYEAHLKEVRDRKSQDEYVLNQGIEQGISAFITSCQELGISRRVTSDKLKEKFGKDDAAAEEYLNRYWV